MRFEFVENEPTNITSEQKSAIQDLLEISDEIKKELGLRTSPINIDGNAVRFSSIIANVRWNDTELIVKPKITKAGCVGTDYSKVMRSLYLKIVKSSRANLKSVIYFTSMATENNDDSFIDSIAQYYLERLDYAMKKLPIVVYYQKEEKRSSIKGKLLIQRELQSPIRDGKTWCRYKVLSQDNAYNALLKWCALYLRDNISSKAIRHKLEQIAEKLDGDVLELSTSKVRSMRLPRNFDAYRESFSIAKDLYLYNNQTTKVRHNSNKLCGYIVNMEVAFENIVSFYVDRYALSRKMLHQAQASIRLATESKHNSIYEFAVRPDDLLMMAGNKLIIDAKYKRILPYEKPSRDDFYQMIASCIGHETAEAILIYPAVDEADHYFKEWALDNMVNGKLMKVYAGKIDIFADDSTIDGQLADIIRGSAYWEVTHGKISC